MAETEQYEITHCGIAASSGLAFGPAHVIKPKKFNYDRYAGSLKEEKKSLKLQFVRLKTPFTNTFQNLHRKTSNKFFLLTLKCLMTQI